MLTGHSLEKKQWDCQDSRKRLFKNQSAILSIYFSDEIIHPVSPRPRHAVIRLRLFKPYDVKKDYYTREIVMWFVSWKRTPGWLILTDNSISFRLKHFRRISRKGLNENKQINQVLVKLPKFSIPIWWTRFRPAVRNLTLLAVSSNKSGDKKINKHIRNNKKAHRLVGQCEMQRHSTTVACLWTHFQSLEAKILTFKREKSTRIPLYINDIIFEIGFVVNEKPWVKYDRIFRDLCLSRRENSRDSPFGKFWKC